MTNLFKRHCNVRDRTSRLRANGRRTFKHGNPLRYRQAIFAAAAFVAVLVPFAPRTFPQSTMPHIATVDPASAKVNDTVTLTGTNLGKASVAGIFLSDDKSDYKATLVDQAAEKIVFKVPQVKPGGYNLSVQSGTQILILPVRFTVEE